MGSKLYLDTGRRMNEWYVDYHHHTHGISHMCAIKSLSLKTLKTRHRFSYESRKGPTASTILISDDRISTHASAYAKSASSGGGVKI